MPNEVAVAQAFVDKKQHTASIVLRLGTYDDCEAQLEFLHSFDWTLFLHCRLSGICHEIPKIRHFTVAARTGVRKTGLSWRLGNFCFLSCNGSHPGQCFVLKRA
jgi:hypothetical protein